MDLGFGVWALGFGVSESMDLGFGVWGLGFRGTLSGVLSIRGSYYVGSGVPYIRTPPDGLWDTSYVRLVGLRGS